MRHQWEPIASSKMTPKGRERSTCRRCGIERRLLGQRWTMYYRGIECIGERAGECFAPDDVDQVEGP